MKQVFVIEFEGEPWLVCRFDEARDVVGIRRWTYPLKAYLFREFAAAQEPTDWISQDLFNQCRILYPNPAEGL